MSDPTSELDSRGRRLRAALVPDNGPELRLVHDWLDSWSGIGLVVIGMAHQGFQVSLGEHGVGRWIAVFFHGSGGQRRPGATHRRGHGAGADAVAGARGVEGSEKGWGEAGWRA